MNPSTRVVQILFRVVGGLYLIAGAFLVIFLPFEPTLTYAGHWAMVALALASLWVAAALPRLIEERSLIPDLLLALMVGVRLYTSRADLFGSASKPAALVGFGIAVVIIAYLWFQVRRLRSTATAE
jgi:hypothetical protein